MPITCEEVKDITTASSYGSDKEFIVAYPKPNPLSPLGPEWKFTPCFLPEKFKNYVDQIENFDVRPDDVFSLTFPKSGSHWSQEMIWLLNNNLDYEAAKEISIEFRFIHIELDICFKSFTAGVIDLVNKLPSPRHLKSHLPAGLLPPQIWTVKPKIIYTCRSSKDTAISYFHHYKRTHQYDGSEQDFLEAYLNDKIIFSPQHSHIKDFWYMCEEENILFLTFEEMKSDMMNVLKKVSKFLGKNYTEEQLRKLENHLSFESMKANDEKLKKEVFQFKKTFSTREVHYDEMG